MAERMTVNGVVFEAYRDMIEVTSLHRPDTAWMITDQQGHEHRWYVGEQPAASYYPTLKYDTPTLKNVHDGWGYYEDGERYGIAHFECIQCGEHVTPRYRADDTVSYIPGILRCRIDGVSVSPEEFERRLRGSQ